MSDCILCSSENLINIQKINTESIVNLYKDELGVDVSNEFKGNAVINALKCNNCKLIYFDPVLPGSEQFYENLQHSDSEYYSDLRPEFVEAIKFINKEDKVLEIGSGSAYFAEQLNIVNFTGLEYNQEAIEKAQKKGIKLIKESIEVFAQSHSEQFDVVCSFHVLEHVPDPYSFIESSLKALKKGGKFICAVPCSDSFYTSNLNHVLNIPPHHTTRWSLDTVDYICRTFNLKPDSVYNDKITNKKNYSNVKFLTSVFKTVYPHQQILVERKLLKLVDKSIKKFDKLFGFHRLVNAKDYKGKNMMLIATKQ